MRTRFLPWLILTITLAACSTNPYDTEVTEAGSQAPIERDTQTPESNQTPQAKPNPATIALLASADEAAQDGKFSDAISYLERAVRMQPRNADLWTKLAQAYLSNHELVNATRHVRKAIALAAGNDIQTRDAWLTMADIKEAGGNANEARSIRRRWRSVRG